MRRPRPARHWNVIDPEKAASLYLGGLSLREAGLRLHCSPSTIRDAVLSLGHQLRGVGDLTGKAWRRRRRRRWGRRALA